MTKKHDQVEIDESERQGLAEAFDKACVKALADFAPMDILKMTSTDGVQTLKRCPGAFKGIDRSTYTWLMEHGVSLTSYYTEMAEYLVKKCQCVTLRHCRSFLKAMFRNASNQRAGIAYIVGKQEEADKNKAVIKSLLLSITHLCDLTFTKNRVGRPSEVLKSILDNGSLGRYLGGTLSYHFMSLIPNIGEIIEGSAGQVDFRNAKKKVMSDEYAVFYESLPRYKQEATRACECIAGNPIVIKGLLPFTDEYYCTKYVPEHSGCVK